MDPSQAWQTMFALLIYIGVGALIALIALLVVSFAKDVLFSRPAVSKRDEDPEDAEVKRQGD